MNTRTNLLFKTIFIYSVIASIFSIVISVLLNKNIIIDYEMMEVIMTKFIVMPMIISIPILCFIYVSIGKIQEIQQAINNLEIVNERFSLKNLCMINIIHNIIFIFNLGFSISFTVLEIITVFIYLNIDKIRATKIYTNFIQRITNKTVYIIFILVFLYTLWATLISYSLFIAEKTSNGGLGMGGLVIYPVAVYPMIISVPYLYLMYLYFNKKINRCNNKKINRCNNKKINFIFKLFCGINIIHNLVFPFNMFYSIPLFILEIGLIAVYLLYIFLKINLKFKPIINIIIWIIFIITYFKSSYLLAMLISILRLNT